MKEQGLDLHLHAHRIQHAVTRLKCVQAHQLLMIVHRHVEHAVRTVDLLASIQQHMHYALVQQHPVQQLRELVTWACFVIILQQHPNFAPTAQW